MITLTCDRCGKVINKTEYNNYKVVIGNNLENFEFCESCGEYIKILVNTACERDDKYRRNIT